MLFEWMSDPAAWAGLATLVLLEIVLGIDNLVFIAILADKLPPEQRNRARIVGLSLALVMRLGLLASISWLMTLTQPLFTMWGLEISWRDVILIFGGVFLLFKGTMELHERLEGAHEVKANDAAYAVYWQVIAQIVVLDAVFSLDSVITAVGMVQDLSIMVIAVIVAILVMMLASRPLMAFVSRHPTVIILCLGFLLMIGFSLIVEGLGFHVPKGYLYAAIGFSILIEAANQFGRRNVLRRVTGTNARDRTARAVLRILRGGQSAPQASEEVAAIISSAGDTVAFSADESSMIERVLTLAERPLRSIMVPRVDAVWLDIEDSPANVIEEIRHSGHSRFPVCRGTVDSVIGVVHAEDLLWQDRPAAGLDLGAALRKPLYVSDTMPILKLLEQFKTSPVQLAVVIDERGAFEGLVTPTDILVAIAGNLPDAGSEPPPTAIRRDDGSWLLDGRLRIAEVVQSLAVSDLHSDAKYTTLAGFMLHHLGHLPQPGESLTWERWTFEVLELDGQRIEKVVASAFSGPGHL
ncbi:TerC family protein [Steroidobacter sp.]|uniref:TerC family protein n=1 Tax=Steroidobacter sp. TaxID=1978227 RepID=UPI001A5B1006|nr:TerC family protein [Steroidobacter sp.]MBL8271136.1 TerC family protein [Steroidobacter sp.]